MDLKPKITATLITYNEEENLPRALQSIDWVDEIIVVDSGSTDRTVEIAKSFGAEVIHQNWLGYGKQKNIAHQAASFPWILNLDADEEISDSLREEILEKIKNKEIHGYRIPRKTKYLGQWILHGGWYPNYLVRLSQKKYSKWTEPEVHEELKVNGPIATMNHPIHHFTFKNLQNQIETNLRYSHQGYQELLKKNKHKNVFLLIFKPIGKFIETYFIKKGFLDGVAGFIISVNAAHSIFLKYAYFFDPGQKK
ncbi:MAG: hypothetical protein CL678_10915 [Bdellovibrionaceae bacterium]|nr:hypothetical protein [Pseudobdellovibrionaceae bacterium]|tara:strand:+ start:2745 stop:3500 length:756 start_codon:yes stop_codon:yes gene_type:complete